MFMFDRGRMLAPAVGLRATGRRRCIRVVANDDRGFSHRL